MLVVFNSIPLLSLSNALYSHQKSPYPFLLCKLTLNYSGKFITQVTNIDQFFSTPPRHGTKPFPITYRRTVTNNLLKISNYYLFLQAVVQGSNKRVTHVVRCPYAKNQTVSRHHKRQLT